MVHDQQYTQNHSGPYRMTLNRICYEKKSLLMSSFSLSLSLVFSARLHCMYTGIGKNGGQITSIFSSILELNWFPLFQIIFFLHWSIHSFIRIVFFLNYFHTQMQSLLNPANHYYCILIRVSASEFRLGNSFYPWTAVEVLECKVLF